MPFRIALALCATLAATSAAALDTRLVASGLNQPVFATAPLDDGRLFVVEKTGRIQLLLDGGASTTFLNLAVASSGERGLLGLAFDPDYGNAGTAGYRRFFVNYTDPTSLDTVVASYRSNAAGTRALAGSRTEVLRIDQPDFNNHKAGWIGFKPGDAGHLYIATGDGGSGNDPFNNAQNTGVLLGKMLRIAVDEDDFADPDINYGIPDDNPFAGTPGARGEIFAYGLRNPWRNSFDRATGDLWIADVGQNEREEVNVIDAASGGGQNFGWRVREGDIATPGVGGPATPDMVDPVLVYDHSFGSSITGGYVVRDASSPLDGQYVFGDFISGRVWAMDADGPRTFASAVEITALLDAGAGGPLGNIASFGEGANGELFIVDYGGKVVQVVPEPGTVALWLAGLAGLAWRVRRRWPAAPRAPSAA